MRGIKIGGLAAAAVLGIMAAANASAAIIVSEVAPDASSDGAPYLADWFELTNTGATDQNITGWKMDDSSASFGSAVAMSGITTIKAGESVVFIDAEDIGKSSHPASTAALISSFESAWFGSNVPAGLQVGVYGVPPDDSGVGLSTSGDAVTIFNSSGTQQAKVTFGAADTSSPYATFDNSAGASAVTLFSVVGTNGAFASVSTSNNEIGSPGTISAVPVPAAAWLFGSGLLGVMGVGRRRKSA